LPNNKVFKMLVRNNSPKNKYIQKITWNNTEYKNSFIKHSDLMAGGNLVIIMGSKPTNFGKEEANWPTSMSL
jgi:putative alpha-1,2-mannosidase